MSLYSRLKDRLNIRHCSRTNGIRHDVDSHGGDHRRNDERERALLAQSLGEREIGSATGTVLEKEPLWGHG